MAAATDVLHTTSFLLVAGGVVGGLLLWPEGSSELASWVFQPTTQSRGDKTSSTSPRAKNAKVGGGARRAAGYDPTVPTGSEPIIAVDGYGRAVQVPPDLPVELYGAYGLTPLPRAYQPGAAQDVPEPGAEPDGTAAGGAAAISPARGPRGDFEYSADPRAHLEALQHGVLGHWYSGAIPDVSVSLLAVLLSTVGVIVLFGKLLGSAYDTSPTAPALQSGDAYVAQQCRVRRQEKQDKKSTEKIEERLRRELAEVEREHIRREGGGGAREVERANAWRQRFERTRSKDDERVKRMMKEEGVDFVQLDKREHKKIRDDERQAAAKRAGREGSSRERERSSAERTREREKEKEKEKDKDKDKDKKEGGRRSFGDWLRQTLLGRDGASTNGTKEKDPKDTKEPERRPKQIAPGVELVDDATAQQASQRHQRQAQETAERLRTRPGDQ